MEAACFPASLSNAQTISSKILFDFFAPRPRTGLCFVVSNACLNF
jgi:hypothetical protein